MKGVEFQKDYLSFNLFQTEISDIELFGDKHPMPLMAADVTITGGVIQLTILNWRKDLTE